MTGDQDDILQRLWDVLPLRWFGDTAPVLDGLLGGLTAAWAWVYGLLAFAVAQTRIATSSGLWLDLTARDYFASRVARRPNETDKALRVRIKQEMTREHGTRSAIVSVITDLTGRPPLVFEPGRPADAGGWGHGLYYGVSGGWGSLSLPFQCFVTAYRPPGNGIALVGGWGNSTGGYGRGALEYASLGMLEGQVTDRDIQEAIVGVLPVACTAWLRINN